MGKIVTTYMTDGDSHGTQYNYHEEYKYLIL